MRAVLSETLRMHPSVPKDAKYAIEADTLPDGTRIAAGCCVFWSNYTMGRDPTLWPEPREFRPERWLRKDDAPDKDGVHLWRPTGQVWRSSASEVSDFKYAAFNAGPRLCLGRPLAYLEMQTVLAAVFGRYELTEAVAHTDEYANSVTLHGPALPSSSLAPQVERPLINSVDGSP